MAYETPKPLNPTLYDGLCRAFGRVVIASPGVGFVGKYRPDIIHGGEELDIVTRGEAYRISCPNCSDTRFRLHINHHWGVRDERGRQNLFLLMCFNDKCFIGNYEAQQSLYRRVADRSARSLETASVDPGNPCALEEPTPPGLITNLADLPPDHPANRYLGLKLLDPEDLGRRFGLGYVEDSHIWSARHRIYVPVQQGGKYLGWQCRYIGDLNWKEKGAPPKYCTLTGMFKGRILMGLDTARLYRTGVVVEGPFDRFNFGPMAMATMGFPISDEQRKLLATHFCDRSVVYLFDPDVWAVPSKMKAVDALVQETRGVYRGGAAAVKLPDGYDPGSLDAAFMRRFVEQEALAQGVKVDWRLV